MDKLFPIFLIVVLAGVALFVWHSGVFTKLGGFTLKSPQFMTIAPPPVVSQQTKTPEQLTIPPAQGTTPLPTQIATSDIPTGFTRAQLSPDFKKVHLSSVYAPNGYAGSYGQIVMYASLGSGESLNITGWQLKGNHGNQYIPQAVNVYDPSGLAGQTDIIFYQGGSLTLYSTQSPVAVNLRLNKCIGYLQTPANFNPPLPATCPVPYLETSINSFSGVCQNYIRSLAPCALPGANPPVPQNEDACQAFLETLNYKGCFDRHFGDHDFLSNQWIAWMGSSFLDQYHDNVALLDNKGLVVDTISY